MVFLPVHSGSYPWYRTVILHIMVLHRHLLELYFSHRAPWEMYTKLKRDLTFTTNKNNREKCFFTRSQHTTCTFKDTNWRAVTLQQCCWIYWQSSPAASLYILSSPSFKTFDFILFVLTSMQENVLCHSMIICVTLLLPGVILSCYRDCNHPVSFYFQHCPCN